MFLTAVRQAEATALVASTVGTALKSNVSYKFEHWPPHNSASFEPSESILQVHNLDEVVTRDSDSEMTKTNYRLTKKADSMQVINANSYQHFMITDYVTVLSDPSHHQQAEMCYCRTPDKNMSTGRCLLTNND